MRLKLKRQKGKRWRKERHPKVKQRREEIEVKREANLVHEKQRMEQTIKKLNEELNQMKAELGKLLALIEINHKLTEKEKNELETSFLKEVEKLKQEKEILKKNEEFKGKTTSKLAENLRTLLPKLPKNSPIRRELLHFLTKDMTIQEVRTMFPMKKSSFYRIRNLKKPKTLMLKYSVGVTRNKVKPQIVEHLKQTVDAILPIQSGRNWRLQEITNIELYKKYLTICEKENSGIVSFSFFENYLRKLNIHHISKTNFCKKCQFKDTAHAQLIKCQT